MPLCFTSESVTGGHPDKLCDKTSDAILDAILRQDPLARVACEVTAHTDHMHIMGEITSTAQVDYAAIARQVIRDTGYVEPGRGFDADSVDIEVALNHQSPDIAMGVDSDDPLEIGAGDQGMMFGFACRETEHYMPLPIELSHRLTKKLQALRESGALPFLLPDGKSQVTVEYDNAGKPSRITSVVVSTQHREDVGMAELRRAVKEQVILSTLPKNMLGAWTEYYINPTGRFVVGGPAGDTGLTGRKIIVDTYGGYARHGGGAFSGKDATKVDRTGAYMARYLAKNIVAQGYMDKCEVQLSYAIGVARPTSIRIEEFGTAHIPDVGALKDHILATLDLRPAAIIERFGLRRPIFSPLAAYGHFGENAQTMPWEQLDLKL
ncbi:MAG: methionine adenosyltransferase [Clostridia bacterium]|nr:methionine adenosyltransferase [Clostridia bacterium]